MSGLGTTDSARALVPGDPDRVAWLAREYGRYAGGACDAARALRRIDTGDWVGPAGDAFRDAIGEVPDKLERGQAAFARAAACLSDYARVLREAQADAAAAIGRYDTGAAATARWRDQPDAPPHDPGADDRLAAEHILTAARDRVTTAAGSAAAAIRRYDTGAAATARWRDQPDAPPHDPGADDRLAAEHILTAARDRVTTAAGRAATVLEDARQGAPHEPGLLSKAVHAVGSFFRGAAEATWGLAQLSYRLSPAYALSDPAGYVTNLEHLGKGVAYGVEHPKELGKALLDWDTWSEDPARALGHLVPDLVLAAATMGGSEAGVAAGRVARGAEATEEIATRGVRAAAAVADLTEEQAALLESRFASPAEEVLEFQGSRPYRGVDDWSDRILQPGDTFSIGTPGEGRFAATPEAVEQVGTDARRYNEGLQVASRADPVDGVARYRVGLDTYEVRQPMPVAESVARANLRFGAGGLPQYFLPDTLRSLLTEGFIEHVGTTAMTDLEARIAPRGISTIERVPAARGALAGGATLTASGTTRLEGCG
jgi:hypothetical protein